MDCADVRSHLLELSRHRLAPPLLDEVERHLPGCAACRRALEEEGALDDVLQRLVARPEAPARLRERLARLVAAPATSPRSASHALARWRRLALPALAAGLALAVVGLLVERRAGEAADAEARLTEELVTDHLRVLASQRPAEIESGGSHQVKPWFEGRLDFAPVVPLPAVADLQLRGGAIGYVLDRRAAVVQYTLRLHRVTMLVVRAQGLDWPPGPPRPGEVRGFQVARWRAGELGYALVSDVNARELGALAETFQGATALAR
jgi:anti-sigma factor RsiW